MKTSEAIEFFGGVKYLADALNLWPQAIYQWEKYPPVARQYQIQVLSKGKLKAEVKK